MTRRPDSYAADRLRSWIREAPRLWETQQQFVRRIQLVGAQFSHALAQRWIEEELAAAAILWDPNIDPAGWEVSDLRVSALRAADDAFRRMEQGGGAGHLGVVPLLRRLVHGDVAEALVEGGDTPALRAAAATHEWSTNHVAAANLYAAAELWSAAEHMLTIALARCLVQEVGDVNGMRAEREELRERLRDAMGRAS